MKYIITQSYLRILPLCLLLMAAGCDDDDWESDDVIDVVYSIGDVLLAIIRSSSWYW